MMRKEPKISLFVGQKGGFKNRRKMAEFVRLAIQPSKRKF